jgi:hypothetical protein
MRPGPPIASRFWVKLGAAAALAALADLLFYDATPGSTVGAFALALILAALGVHPPLRKDQRARWALGAALVLALAQIDAPSVVGALLFDLALGVAVLSPRAPPREDGWRWLQRLAALTLLGWIGWAIDGLKLRRLIRAKMVMRRLTVIVLPLAGGAVFLTLFAAANPIIETTLESLTPGAPDIPRLLFAALMLVLAWTFLRPRHLRLAAARPTGGCLNLPGMNPASVAASLVLFNALFVIENSLDVAFLWSGAPLPRGVSLADYAHRGAYPLILTALLAGLFVLAVFQPGSALARSAWPRRLVVFWIVQNLVLVASSLLRTLDYVEAYSLTRLRIAALVWMALVAIGLVLICWRLLRGKSASWLIDANMAAAGLALAACGIVDLGSLAATWNVRHAREVGGAGARLDLCYLNNLGASALVPLSELEARPLTPAFRDRVAFVRDSVAAETQARQDHWRGWTWRDRRRLARADAIRPGHGVLLVPSASGRDCDGALLTAAATPAR